MRRSSHVPTCLQHLKPLLRGAGIVTALMFVTSFGCGRSDMGTVTGTVTLDGKPLAEAFVEFVPTGGQGSTSSGRTDSSGEYELMFSRDVRGASLGPATVRITTRDVSTDDQGNEIWLPEKVPGRYNAKSELSVEVKPGSNRFDFDLKSDETKSSP